jgi:tetratricopeptide (TPR) repeat protein
MARTSVEAGAHFGPWVVVAPLARGGTGRVYLGVDSRSGTNCAIKILTLESEERRRQFEAEAQAIARLQHAHICRLLDVGLHDDLGYLVMPFLEGETLAARLRAGPLPIREVVQLGMQVASALAHAHAHGILHRDVKPANVMLTKAGAMLLDFGLAAVRDAPTGATIAQWAEGHSGSGDDPATLPAGTLYYMAPEQLTGGVASSRTDLFAVGAVLYECVTGRRAFEAASVRECIRRTLDDDPIPLATVLPETPKRLQLVIDRCLAKRVDARPVDALEVARSLDAVSSSRTWRRRAWLGSTAAVMALLVGSLTIPYWSRDPRLIVLPCRAATASDDSEALCRGLTVTMTTKLHRVSRANRLQVVPALEVRDAGVTTLDEARSAFGATLVVGCELSNAAPEQHVSCELVDAVTRKPLDAYDSAINPTLPLAVQDHVVQWAMAALRLQTGSHTTGPPPAERSAAQHEADALYLQGQGYLLEYHEAANLDKAEDALTAALARDPHMTAAAAALGRTYLTRFRVGRTPALFERARDICERALAQDPANPDSQLCMADLLRESAECAKALTYYRQALNLDPATDEAYYGQARCEEQLGRFDDAQRTYELYIRAHPGYWGGYGWLAELYRRRGNYVRAAELWRKVVDVIPGSAAAHASLAAVYIYGGQHEKAVRELTRSRELRDTFIAAYNLGNLYMRQRRYEDAIRVLEAAIALPDRDWHAAGALARAYQGAGRHEQAVPLYREAVRLITQLMELNPDDAELHLLLAQYDSQLGDADAVRQQLAAAHVIEGDRLCPTDSHSLLFAAIAYETIGDRERAMVWLAKARARDLSQAELEGWFELDALRAAASTKH